MFESALLFDKYLSLFFIFAYSHRQYSGKIIKKILTFIGELAQQICKINNKKLRVFYYSFSATAFRVLRSFLSQDVHIR